VEEALKSLQARNYHLALITSDFSPEEVRTLKQNAPLTSFIVLLFRTTRRRPFDYILKGARQVVCWPNEFEFTNYLCQRELRERALLLGQELLRSKTKELGQVSAELHRIQQVLQIVVEQAAEMGVVVTDESFRPFFVNTTAQEFIQASSARDFRKFLVYLLGRDPQEEISRRIAEEGRYFCEVQVPQRQKIFVLTVKPLEQQERLVGLVFFIQDVTQEREWQKRLAHMQKMEALATLTAGIAHDFNNLLGAIRLKAELLLPKLSNGARQYVFDIISICDRAARVVHQIMAVNCPASRPRRPTSTSRSREQLP
jgi:signal transduction histidine kinase